MSHEEAGRRKRKQRQQSRRAKEAQALGRESERVQAWREFSLARSVSRWGTFVPQGSWRQTWRVLSAVSLLATIAITVYSWKTDTWGWVLPVVLATIVITIVPWIADRRVRAASASSSALRPSARSRFQLQAIGSRSRRPLGPPFGVGEGARPRTPPVTRASHAGA